MNMRSKWLLASGFLLLPLALLVGATVLSREVKISRAELDQLRHQKELQQRHVLLTERRIKNYKEILGALEEARTLDVPVNDVNLFSLVQKQLTINGMLSRLIDETKGTVTTDDLHPSKGVKISFEGPYEGFIRTLADWRKLSIALRVQHLVLSQHEGNFVRGDIVLETVTGR
ncbi:MAG: hypothetical protein CSA35_03680 [Dethiosulfovibrio peptidovorans]|nr:MAG: hypothetical protein CSA35_03680 [Dethiosulfovibrio peptidovorans]